MAGFRYDLIPPGTAVLCALSGGADSMYLLCRLLEGGCAVKCAHYNHRLRDTAQRDEDFVRRWCADRGVPLLVGSGPVAAEAERLGQGVEETARRMRYAFLEETAKREGCRLIATGHHSGDQAETVLMNLIRGSGLKGLSGIPEQRGRLIRPMLGISRQEILTYLNTHGVPHVEDETNFDTAYTRNKVRHQLIPLLEELNPRAVSHICAAAARLREDGAELDRQGQELAAQAEQTADGVTIPLHTLCAAPRSVALRAVFRLTEQVGGSCDAAHGQRVLELCGGDRPSGQLELPGCTVRRVYDRLEFAPPGQRVTPEPIPLKDGENRWGDWVIRCEPSLCPTRAYVSREEFYLKKGSYLIRSRREGDGLRLGKRPNKTVKKLMIEEQIPTHLRPRIPILEGEGTAAAAGGLGPHVGALAEPGEACLHITVRKGE